MRRSRGAFTASDPLPAPVPAGASRGLVPGQRRWPRPAGARPLDAEGGTAGPSAAGAPDPDVTPRVRHPETCDTASPDQESLARGHRHRLHPPREPGAASRSRPPPARRVPPGPRLPHAQGRPSFPAALAAGQGRSHVTGLGQSGAGAAGMRKSARRAVSDGASEGGVLEPLGGLRPGPGSLPVPAGPEPSAPPGTGEPAAPPSSRANGGLGRKRDEYQRLGPWLPVTSSSPRGGQGGQGGGHGPSSGPSRPQVPAGVRRRGHSRAVTGAPDAGSGRPPAAITAGPPGHA